MDVKSITLFDEIAYLTKIEYSKQIFNNPSLSLDDVYLRILPK